MTALLAGDVLGLVLFSFASSIWIGAQSLRWIVWRLIKPDES